MLMFEGISETYDWISEFRGIRAWGEMPRATAAQSQASYFFWEKMPSQKRGSHASVAYGTRENRNLYGAQRTKSISATEAHFPHCSTADSRGSLVSEGLLIIKS